MARNTKARKTDVPPKETTSQRILLEEFRSLHTDYVNLRSEGISRLNFFITAISVTLGGVLIFAASSYKDIPVFYFKIILLPILAVLAIIGIEIHSFLIQRDIASDRSIRGLARIRHYFIELDPNIKDYFVNRISDTPSGYLINKSSGMRSSAQIIEGFLIGLLFTVSLTFVRLSLLTDVGVGIGATIATIILLEIKARHRLNNAMRNAEKYMIYGEDFS